MTDCYLNKEPFDKGGGTGVIITKVDFSFFHIYLENCNFLRWKKYCICGNCCHRSLPDVCIEEKPSKEDLFKVYLENLPMEEIISLFDLVYKEGNNNGIASARGEMRMALGLD